MTNTNKRILYISYDGMTDPLGQSQVIPYLAGLAAAGYEITLLSFEKKERYDQHQPLIAAILHQNKITWRPLFYTKRPPVLSTLWDISRMIGTAARLHRERPFALVHCRSYISALAGLSMRRRFGTKFVFDMRGFWADERVEGGIWDLNNVFYKQIYRYFKSKEKQYFEQADYTISLTERAKKEIQSWPSIVGHPVPIQVIPCCADLSLFDYHTVPVEATAGVRSSLGIGGTDFVISYLGSIGTWYMLDEMLDFFRALLAKKPQAKFLFITPDEPQGIYTAAASRGIDPASVVVRSASRAEVPLLLSASDLALFFIRPTFSKMASSPTKQGEIMGMGIPLICNAGVGDTDSIVEAAGCGTIIATLDAAGYERAIDSIDSLLRIDRAAIREGAEAYYSLQNGIKKYLFVYQTILS